MESNNISEKEGQLEPEVKKSYIELMVKLS